MVESVKRVNPSPVRKSKTGKVLYGFGSFNVVSDCVCLSVMDGELTMESTRVLFCLMHMAQRNNRVEVTQAVVGERLGMTQSHVSRAFKALKERGFLIRSRDSASGCWFWYLDPRRTFRGSAEAHQRSLERHRKARERARRSNVVALSSVGGASAGGAK